VTPAIVVAVVAAVVAFAAVLGALWLTRQARSAARARLRRWARRTVHEFRARIDRYKRVSPRVVRDEILRDPVVGDAVTEHAAIHGIPEADIRPRVEEYIREIVPYFDVLSYYRFGYNFARLFLDLFYRVSVDYQDELALSAIPTRDVVIYLPNHRSNADYVALAYVLARRVSVSYAVGEWARTWPLEYVFKSFGSYFIRRGFREPLYHAVLERYVQLVTRNGLTQGIFLEGGLSRDGRLRPAKIGLLDYVIRTLREPSFDRDLWLVPVAINYDRVLEDRTLIREQIEGVPRPGRLEQLGSVLHYVSRQLMRMATRRLRRYGRAAVNFGSPVSARGWLSAQPADVLDLPRSARLPRMQELADDMLHRVAAIIPVTPVPLASAALLSFEASAMPLAALLERMDEMRDQLLDGDAKVVRGDRDIREVWDRAWKMLSMRRLVVAEDETLVILPRHRPLLEYYANSIVHLLPPQLRPIHKEHEVDRTLPHLRESGTMDRPASH
jgi:glycerol-3-phosphate O-acyltransferase